MYLSVQLAARRLGVSPHTIRRWTASGFLPCTRTAGGHRRIKQEDIDELSHLIGDSNQLAARLARERELETLVNTAVVLSSRLDLPELLAEIARQVTGLLGCHFCSISDFDEDTRIVNVLADFDNTGRRWPDWRPYSVNEFPLTRRVLTEQEIAVVNVSDPSADPAEVTIMRRQGSKGLLLVPLVHQGRSIGLLEAIDHLRERRWTRQELRFARALASQAAVALHNARIFGRLRRADADVHRVEVALERVADGLPALFAQAQTAQVLKSAAALSCAALDAISGVAKLGADSAAASGRPAADAPATRRVSDAAHVAAATAPVGDDELTLTVTLPNEAGEGTLDVLRLLAVAAAQAVAAHSSRT